MGASSLLSLSFIMLYFPRVSLLPRNRLLSWCHMNSSLGFLSSKCVLGDWHCYSPSFPTLCGGFMDFEKLLRKAAKRDLSPIMNSKCFTQIFNSNMVDEPLPTLQLGMAMLLDKPIYLLVPYGAKLPENLKKVAVQIDYFDRNTPGSLQLASERLKKFINEMDD